MAQKDFGVAIRLDPATRSLDSSPNYLDVVTALHTKLSDSIMQSWANGIQPAINPHVRLRIEPTKLYCDLIATDCDIEAALTFRNDAFNADKFRANLNEGITIALARWRKDEFDKAVISSAQGIELVVASS